MITCYAQHNKAKSLRVLQAFADGCGAHGTRMRSVDVGLLDQGDCAFYGVRPPWLHLWDQAKQFNREWFYLDNSYFDCARELYFRIGINAVQSWSRNPSDGTRLAKLGVKVHPWRKRGDHVLVCPQTQEFLTTVAGRPNWLQDSIAEIKQFTDRKIVVRNKLTMHKLSLDLQNAHILVCHSSAAAVEALCAGVPVIVTDAFAACATFSASFNDIENPRMPDNRLEFMARLADSQFELHELRDGTAWKIIESWNL